MDSSSGGIGRHGGGGARQLPTLRQEPLLPVSPHQELVADHFNGDSQAGDINTRRERRRSSSNAQSSDQTGGNDWRRPPSSGRFGAGSEHSVESGDRGGIGQAQTHRPDDEAKTGHSNNSGSQEWRPHPDLNEAQPDESTWRGSADGRPLGGSLVAESPGVERQREVGLRSREGGSDGRENPQERRVRTVDRLMERIAYRVTQQQESDRSAAELSLGSRSSRAERSSAEEEERRRRKEERRVKRAEKGMRRTEVAERGARVGRGEEQREERQSHSRGASGEDLGKSESSGDRVRGREEACSGVQAPRDAVNRSGGALDMVPARKNEGSHGIDGCLETGEAGFAAGEVRVRTRLDRSLEDGLHCALREGTEGAVPEKGVGGRLGMSTSIVNDAYEEEDEAVLLHSAIRFDEATGQLTSTFASLVPAVEEKKQQLYLEGGTDGSFLRTHTDSDRGDGMRRWWRPAAWQRRDGDDDDVEGGTPGAIVLRVACEQVAGCLALVAHFANSLLGGFALLNFYLTYLYNVGSLPGGFLSHYSPVAISCQRTFLVLTSICLLAACDKYAKDKLAEWKPRGSVQWRHDLLVIAALFLAFVLSVVGTPFEDYVFQQNMSSPDWYSSVGSTTHFKVRLKAWHVLNFMRLGACAVGFFVVMLDGNVTLRTARAQTLKATRLLQSTSGAVLSETGVRGNTIKRSLPATRMGVGTRR